MNEFRIETAIDRPVEDVFTLVSSFERYPDWNSHLTAARQTSAGPLATGTTAVVEGRMLGRHFQSDLVFSDYQANRSIASRSTSGPFYFEVEYRFLPRPGGTNLTTVVRGESRGFLKLAEPVALRLTRRQFELAAENLKALLESEQG